MRSLLDVMKVSAVGAILLSALAACNSKPESNPTPPPSDDDRVEVIIEQVVDGKVVDTRVVGRTDVVKYTGKTDGDDVAQIVWPDDVNCNKPFDFTYWAKPGLYLKAGGYRFNQTESPRMTTFGIDTYGQTEAIKEVQQKVTCYPKGNKKIYVRLEYKNINNPNKESDYDYVLSVVTESDYIDYRDRWSNGFGMAPYETSSFECSGYRVHHRFTFTALKTDSKDFREIELGLGLNTNNGVRPREIRKAKKGGQWGEEWQYQKAGDVIVSAKPYDFVLNKKVMGLSLGDVVSFDYVFGFDSSGAGNTAPLRVQYDNKPFDAHETSKYLREFTDYGLRFNYKNQPTDSQPIIKRISYAKTSTNAKIYINPKAYVKAHGHYTLDTTPSN